MNAYAAWAFLIAVVLVLNGVGLLTWSQRQSAHRYFLNDYQAQKFRKSSRLCFVAAVLCSAVGLCMLLL